MEKRKITENEQIRKVLNENPTLPVYVLTQAVGEWEGWCYYYHIGVEAYVRDLLEAGDLDRKVGHTFGLNEEKIYSDEDDAAEDVDEWLYDNAKFPWEDHDERYRIAVEIVGELPWVRAVVIEASL